jgi:hypothetical protein
MVPINKLIVTIIKGITDIIQKIDEKYWCTHYILQSPKNYWPKQALFFQFSKSQSMGPAFLRTSHSKATKSETLKVTLAEYVLINSLGHS